MPNDVIVIGSGIGGLTVALRLARAGVSVRVLEARQTAGGLAAGLEVGGFAFDGGPYILLDRPGLDWAFRELGVDAAAGLSLKRISDIYTVEAPGQPSFHLLADRDATAQGLDQHWPGSGALYCRFVDKLGLIYGTLGPLQRLSRPGIMDLIRTGAWKYIPFLLRSLGTVLQKSGLPVSIQEALAIWTHIAGQEVVSAPSPLAFVPSLIHTVGAFVPEGGIRAIPSLLAKAAENAGVRFHYGEKAKAIRVRSGRVQGVETVAGDYLPTTAVVSNASGLSTYLEMTEGLPSAAQTSLRDLSLQSPGLCAYLAVRGTTPGPYLRFRLPGRGELCRLFIRPGALSSNSTSEDWQPARLMAPLRHDWAETAGVDGQRAYLDRLLAEDWWQKGLTEWRILATRVPVDWGAEFHLYRNSMNPVMTAAFMRAGRLHHRSPWIRGLYLAGSATHPGQWVSFCAISGILAADRLLEDLPLC